MLSSQLPTHDFAAYQALNTWYRSPLGQHLLEREQALVNDLLTRRFGYHLLQLGCADLQLHQHSPMGHKFSFTPFAESVDGFQAVAEPDAIPLGNASVDCVLMHHALDFALDQYQLLREVTRVLIAGGHLIIVGFNPLSMWGLRNKLHIRRHRVPWQAQMLSSPRLSDWLKLLDFQVDEIRYGEYALPINNPRAIRYSACLDSVAMRLNWPTGGVYVIAARKQVLPLTPIRLQRRRLAVPSLVLPLAEKNTTGVQQRLPLAAKQQP